MGLEQFNNLVDGEKSFIEPHPNIYNIMFLIKKNHSCTMNVWISVITSPFHYGGTLLRDIGIAHPKESSDKVWNKIGVVH